MVHNIWKGIISISKCLQDREESIQRTEPEDKWVFKINGISFANIEQGHAYGIKLHNMEQS